jgi:hypothetical protein
MRIRPSGRRPASAVPTNLRRIAGRRRQHPLGVSVCADRRRVRAVAHVRRLRVRGLSPGEGGSARSVSPCARVVVGRRRQRTFGVSVCAGRRRVRAAAHVRRLRVRGSSLHRGPSSQKPSTCASTVEFTTVGAHVDGLRACVVAMATEGAHGGPACASAVAGGRGLAHGGVRSGRQLGGDRCGTGVVRWASVAGGGSLAGGVRSGRQLGGDRCGTGVVRWASVRLGRPASASPPGIMSPHQRLPAGTARTSDFRRARARISDSGRARARISDSGRARARTSDFRRARARVRQDGER